MGSNTRNVFISSLSKIFWGFVMLRSPWFSFGEAGRLPPSGYTGGVDDIIARSCPRCEEWRQEAQVVHFQRSDGARQVLCTKNNHARSANPDKNTVGLALWICRFLIFKRRLESWMLNVRPAGH